METQKIVPISELIEQLMDRVHAVEDGHEKALPVYSDLHILEKSIKDLKKDIQSFAINEAGKYHKDEAPVFHGHRPVVSSRKNFTFKHDDTWQSYEAKKKERESLMKKAMNANITDPDTGELIPPAEFTESIFIKMERAI